MSNEKLLETLGQVKDEYILEAAPKEVLDNKSGNKTKILYPYLKWGALAACLCIIVGLGLKTNLFSASKEDAAFEAKDQMKPATESESILSDTRVQNQYNNVKSEADYSYAVDTNSSVAEDNTTS